MRPLLVFITAILLQHLVKAQVVETYKKDFPVVVPECVEKLYKAQRSLPAYYEAGKKDSIKAMLLELESGCEPATSTYPVEVILRISEDRFSTNTTDELLQNLITYKEDQDFITENKEQVLKPGYYDYYPDWGEVTLTYYQFVQKMATDVLTQQNLKPLERDLLRFYAGEYDQLLSELRKDNYSGNPLQEVYNRRIASSIQDEGLSFAIFTGYWMPTENLADLGNHPEIGLQGGYFKGKMKYGLMLSARFLKTPDDYRVRQNDSNYVTDKFNAILVGAEIGRALYKGARNELDLNLGIAYDGITVVAGDEEEGIDPVMVESINLNLGLEYRFYYNLKNYLALDARYHFLNYQNNINNDLTGNALTVRLAWGFTTSYNRRDTLKNLGY